MADPGILSSQIPPGEDWLVRRVADLERAVRELGPSVAKSFQPVIDDLIAKQATLDAQQATLTAAVADIAANLASINDLLTQVVKPQYVYAYAVNFALSTAMTTKLTSTITVPAGFTSAVVSVTGRVFALNPNTTGGAGTGADYLYGMATINGLSGHPMPLLVGGSGGSDINVDSYSTVLTGLTPGGTFPITVDAQSLYAAWAANASNITDLSGSILWLR